MSQKDEKTQLLESDEPIADGHMLEYISTSHGKMQAQISSLKDGLQVITGVCIVRVRSKESRLLIMEDYMSIIGEIDGGVDFIGKDFVRTLDKVKGFFCHEHNVFFFLLRESDKERRAGLKHINKVDTERANAAG
jgi:hypothetical protein